MNDPLRPVVYAYTAVCEALSATATGSCIRDRDGTVLAVSGAPAAALNAVISPDLDPDPDVIEELAAGAGPTGLPWSIKVRGVPGQRVTEVAYRHGLTRVTTQPLMIRRPDAGVPARTTGGSPRVVPLRDDEFDLYVTTLAEGFEAPREVFDTLVPPGLPGMEGITYYLAWVDGVPVGTGMAAVSGDLLGVYNIAVLPGHRRQGHGRAITTEIVRAGQEIGATTAYLYSSGSAEHVYASAGFRTAEMLTSFAAPE
ncbi:GNAT family N-acetyltransferase [Streptomyces polygonati]|uniref:GNAT family N-acetyltransferase n=1 Tax=Streptomyces polygonati TaxID=1617087 RepID=A0ABV8HMP8_9ACTN